MPPQAGPTTCSLTALAVPVRCVNEQELYS